ncbi:MAG: hypothetical protein QM713_17735 [Arachnia sp.]
MVDQGVPRHDHQQLEQLERMLHGDRVTSEFQEEPSQDRLGDIDGIENPLQRRIGQPDPHEPSNFGFIERDELGRSFVSFLGPQQQRAEVVLVGEVSRVGLPLRLHAVPRIQVAPGPMVDRAQGWPSIGDGLRRATVARSGSTTVE